MSGKKNSIRICREKTSEKRQRGTHGWEMLLSAFFTACTACTWWAGMLSVFPLGLSSVWLYAGIAVFSPAVAFIVYRMKKRSVLFLFFAAGIYLWFSRESVFIVFSHGGGEERTAGLAAAVMSLPLLYLWAYVLRAGKGRLAAGVLMAAPFIAAACAGYFPSMSASWLLFFAGVMYYAFFALGRTGQAFSSARPAGRTVLLRAVLPVAAVGCVFAVIIGISVFAGRYLDKGREVEGSFYQSARAWLYSEVVEGTERLIGREGSRGEEKREDEDASEEEDGLEQEQADNGEEAALDNPVMAPAADGGEQGGENFGEAALETGSAMRDLKAVSAFVPDDEAAEQRGIILPERPTETVYFPLRYGVSYHDDSWTEEEVLYKYVDSLQGDETGAALSSAEKQAYTEYPHRLERLEKLCGDWDKTSLQTVAEQIDKTLSSMAEYDINPGPTPEDQYFPEYFLFENKRGFCVHFATTAVLLYRMRGYPARYAEGYAIPPSAFERTGNGTYNAVIDGSMGHAWCQVFDEEKGEWLDMEHTPPSSGVIPKENGGILDSTRGWEGRISNIIKRAALAGSISCGAVLLLLGVIVSQAYIRRKKLQAEMQYCTEDFGLLAMYDVILRTARLDKGVFKSVKDRKGLSESTLEILKSSYPMTDPKEWDSFYMQVMRVMFACPADTGIDREEWERADRFFQRFTEMAKRNMNKGKRLLYRYVYCLDILPGGKDIKIGKGEQ